MRRSIGWLGNGGKVYFRFTLFSAALMTCRICVRALPYLPLSEAAHPNKQKRSQLLLCEEDAKQHENLGVMQGKCRSADAFKHTADGVSLASALYHQILIGVMDRGLTHTQCRLHTYEVD